MKHWTSQLREAPYIKQLGLKLTIYTKDQHISLSEMKTATGADEVHRLPNIGREGQTMLHHLITHYDSPTLPQFTMFGQDELELSLDDKGNMYHFMYKHLWKELRPNTGFLGLNEWNELCTCGDCDGRGQFPLQVAIYNMLEQKVCHKENWNDLWSQFIVSRSRIRSRPLESYIWLERMISAPLGHWIHNEKQPDFIKDAYMHGSSTPSNPLFGHTIERSWGIVFKCSFREDYEDPWMGWVDGRNMHCWDWSAKDIIEDGDMRTGMWPGFEDADKEWESMEEKWRVEDEERRVQEEKRKAREEEEKRLKEEERKEEEELRREEARRKEEEEAERARVRGDRDVDEESAEDVVELDLEDDDPASRSEIKERSNESAEEPAA